MCAPGSAIPSATITFAMAASNSASEPGRIDTHSSDSSAVFERRGSTTTTLPPRALIAWRRPGKSGAVHMLPFDAYGLAPSISRKSVRSRSGTGTATGDPNTWPDATWRGI